MGTVNGTLRRARARIVNRTSWTTGAEARDAAGREVDPFDPTAVRWDAGGAIRREAGRGLRGTALYVGALLAIADALGTDWQAVEAFTEQTRAADRVRQLNDQYGQHAVIDALDRAIHTTTPKENW